MTGSAVRLPVLSKTPPRGKENRNARRTPVWSPAVRPVPVPSARAQVLFLALEGFAPRHQSGADNPEPRLDQPWNRFATNATYMVFEQSPSSTQSDPFNRSGSPYQANCSALWDGIRYDSVAAFDRLLLPQAKAKPGNKR
jgi:hypothetical protein